MPILNPVQWSETSIDMTIRMFYDIHDTSASGIYGGDRYDGEGIFKNNEKSLKYDNKTD